MTFTTYTDDITTYYVYNKVNHGSTTILIDGMWTNS